MEWNRQQRQESPRQTMLRQMMAKPQSTRSRATASDPRPCVLLVEGEPEQAVACSQLLEREGLKVVRAATRKEGLQVAEQEHPEVVVADVTLSDGSAYDLAMELKHLPAMAQVPVVGMSESNANPETSEASSSLLAARLRKPIEPEVLGKAIRDLLAQRITKRVRQRRERRFKIES